MSYPAVPFDPEVAHALKILPSFPADITIEQLVASRALPSPFATPYTSILSKLPFAVSHEDIIVPDPYGSQPVTLAIFRPDLPTSRPKKCIYYIHGGGLVKHDRFFGINAPLTWMINDAILISVEYRLAPESRYPAAVNDCYTGLEYVSSHASELGIDPNAILIAGHSAGGGLAAAVALMARDRRGPKLLGQCLVYPMLDDRNNSVSCVQYATVGTWTQKYNAVGWTAYLGEATGKDGVDYYAAPGRAEYLGGLPQSWVDVGSAEPFRDECVAYARRLWEAGVQCELYVAPGGFHGYDGIAPHSQIARMSSFARDAWVKRVFERVGMEGSEKL